MPFTPSHIAAAAVPERLRLSGTVRRGVLATCAAGAVLACYVLIWQFRRLVAVFEGA